MAAAISVGLIALPSTMSGFEAHPICFVADRPSDTPIDYEAIMGWFHTLALTDGEIATFWDIHDHGDTAHTRGESL
jgi:hypothetical protein